jgi:hypothetical protein
MTVAIVAATLAAADTRGTVTIDTSALANNANGPFTIDVQFIEGDGGASGNNSVTLTNFSLGGGSIVTAPASLTGGVTVAGSPFSVVLANTSFFQDVQFSFTPGSSLTFQYDSTSNVDPVAPDTFTLAIFDSNGNEIPTTNANGFNSFVEIDLPTTGSGTQVGTASGSSGLGVTASATVIPSCDISGNPSASVLDIQHMINEALGTSSPANDLNVDGMVNLVDVQLVLNNAMGLGCPVS